MSEDKDSKQFEPTQKRLDDARKRGEVPKSTDLTTFAVYGGWTIVALTLGATSVISLAGVLSSLLDQADYLSVEAFGAGAVKFRGELLVSVLSAAWPWFALPAFLAFLSILGQRAFVFAPDKITPKLSRLSPMQNAKNKFGRAGLFEFLKSVAKLSLFSIALGVYLSFGYERILGSIFLIPAQVSGEFGALVTGLMKVVLLISGALGLGDALWQAAEHRRKNMMSREDLKEETKQAEGDPMQKQQRRQKAIEIALNGMLSDVAEADVVIVNPTHYAVALKWDKMSTQPPILMAKGVDEIAARIREAANEHAVPIRSDPPTARAIHATVELGEPIQPDQYRAVAAAIRFAEAIRKKARS